MIRPPPRATRTDTRFPDTTPFRPLTRDDVEGVYAGLRPLLAGEDAATSKLSREHAVAHSVPGLVVVAGGKYTTYRVMAKDRSEEHTSELQSLMRISYAVFCLKTKKKRKRTNTIQNIQKPAK